MVTPYRQTISVTEKKHGYSYCEVRVKHLSMRTPRAHAGQCGYTYLSLFILKFDASLSVVIFTYRLNPLNAKRRLLYLKTQFVLRSKHFSSWL